LAINPTIKIFATIPLAATARVERESSARNPAKSRRIFTLGTKRRKAAPTPQKPNP
jgi:hypothetical protein